MVKQNECDKLLELWRAACVAYGSSNASLSGCAVGQSTRSFERALRNEEKAVEAFRKHNDKLTKKYLLDAALQPRDMVDRILQIGSV